MPFKFVEDYKELEEFMKGKTIDRIGKGDAEYDDENNIYPVGISLIIFTDGTFVDFTAYSGVFKLGEGAVV